MECLNACELEMFGAETDFEHEFLDAYENETTDQDGMDEMGKLYRPEDKAEVS